MSDGPKVEIRLPEGWEPGKCSVPADNEKSCPFSFRGCYVYKPALCPIVKLVARARIVIPAPIQHPTPIKPMPKGWRFRTSCYGCVNIKKSQMAPPCDNCIGVAGQRRNFRPGGRP